MITRKYYFPLSFTNNILDAIVGQECYSFLDGFLGYNQISIIIEDKTKTTFTIDWDTSSYIKMHFGLCNALSTFQRVMMTTFEDYFLLFMEIFLDDFCIFSNLKDHGKKLQLCFDHCIQYGISLKVTKCSALVLIGKLLGHIISQDEISMDLAKIEVIIL